jgi:type VI secretion system protein ImpJ
MDSASYLSGSGLYAVKQCLKSVYRTQRLLANLKGQVHLHPFHTLEALKELYTEVCFYRDTAPRDVADPYHHDQLATCFKNVLGPLKEQMQLAQKRSPYLPFALRDGVYRIDLPAEIKEAKEVFFLIQKNQVSRTVSLATFKISAGARLSMIHKLALEGIPVKRVDRPALAQSFGSEVEFYQLGAGEEWDHGLREGAVSFYDRPEFDKLEFYLYWYS